MARSPLLRDLVKMAHPSRRAFVRGAGAGSLWLAAGAPGALAQSRRVARKVVVIGGGISGLTAALKLMDAGADVTVYEASPRLGGRMHSQRGWADGQVSEWGGELIDSSHATIQALAARFNLVLDDLTVGQAPGVTETYYFLGQSYARADASRDFAALLPALTADADAAGPVTSYSTSTPGGRALDAMSLYDWIESRVPGGHAAPLGLLLDAAYAIEFGADTRDQSALNLITMLASQPDGGGLAVFGQSDERYHIRGGNDQLPLAMAKFLGERVQLEHTLESLTTLPDGRVELGVARGFGLGGVSREVADAVILSLPFAALARVDLRASGFDALKLKAIHQLGRAKNGKLHLQFHSRPWAGHGSTGTTYADTGYQCSWEVSRAQPGPRGLLVNYTGGGPAGWGGGPYERGNSLAVRLAARRFLRQAEPALPGLQDAWTGDVSASHPHKDEHLGLSYSYWRVGQCQTIAGYERVPQGNVFFAGEHCSTDYQGYMEGGAAEGARAADEVLASR